MKVYLAAGFSRKEEIAEKSKELENLGIKITSTWPWEEDKSNNALSCAYDLAHVYARKDLDEILAADTMILFTHEPTHKFCRGGRMHEAGFAMGLGKTLMVCGPRENIFHYLPEVSVFSTWEDLKSTLVKAILV